MSKAAGQIFLDYSVEKLRQYLARIEACLERLEEQQIWSRGGTYENAIGNLCLHLAGNVRQWIGSGVANWPNDRDRDGEFAAQGGVNKAALAAKLRAAVEGGIAVLETLPLDRLTDRTRVQGYELSVMEAIYHVVEHCSGHAGQILFLTKALTGEDLGFYAHLRRLEHSEKTP